jgi:peptide/nickel transport system permease protein
MSIVSLLLVSAFVFVLVQLSPVDPVVLALGDGAPPAKVIEMRRELGLDQPVVIQFLVWLGGIVRGVMPRKGCCRLESTRRSSLRRGIGS